MYLLARSYWPSLLYALASAFKETKFLWIWYLLLILLFIRYSNIWSDLLLVISAIVPNTETKKARPNWEEIGYDNKIFDPSQYFFLRSSANCNHAEGGIQLSEPHVDHDFPHWNMIVYLEGDGSTFVEGEEYVPKEDDIILFKGEHYMQRPSKGRRVILVSTIYEINNIGGN